METYKEIFQNISNFSNSNCNTRVLPPMGQHVHRRHRRLQHCLSAVCGEHSSPNSIVLRKK